ncbi:DUF2972 domain-containing protein, partial [Campylobacter volucris]|uniref:DUF2972 domain-containing protein n=1 Tax=Campylobacter volucris TaxID=1031542 RepID=UPI0018A0C432
LKNFVLKIEERIDKDNNKILKTDDVINYFLKNLKAKKYIKKILNKELFYIKKDCPDIVNSWKYYQYFMKL